MSGKDGVDKVAGGGGESEDELRRGEGGYNDGTAAGEAGGGVEGAGNGGVGSVNVVMRMVEMLERRIRELEKQIRTENGGVKGIEFVNVEQMTPTVLKEGVAFRT